MTLPKPIQNSISSRQVLNPSAPSNLFELDLDALVKLGYKQALPTDEIKDGYLLEMAEKKLWCVITHSASMKKILRRSEVGTLFLLKNERNRDGAPSPKTSKLRHSVD